MGMVFFYLRMTGKGAGAWFKTAGCRIVGCRSSTASQLLTYTATGLLRSLLLAADITLAASQSGNDNSV
jgi:hypothetical protein